MDVRILVVDDEIEIADLIELYLKNENYLVDKFYCGQDALNRCREESYDLAILDIMLPDIDGYTLLQEIRKSHTFPIIMLTAKIEEIDKITGLTLGADDYMTKPFRPLEMVARVKAQLRRSTKYNNQDRKDDAILAFSGLVLDKHKHECMLNERMVTLTPTEFSILWILCENRGQVISADRLFQEVWGEKYYANNNNTIMVHIRHLREKMNDTAEKPKYIKTVWGVGYKIEE